MLRTNHRGIACVVLSAFFFGLLPIVSKYIYANGGTPLQTMYVRCFAIPALYGILRRQRVGLRVTRRQGAWLFALSMLGSIVTGMTLLYSYTLLPSGTATTLHFLYCALTAVGCAVFLKNRLTPLGVGSVLICTLGVSLLSSPQTGGNAAGVFLAVLSAVAYAGYSILLMHSGLHDMHPLKIMFYLNLFALITLTLLNAATGIIAFTMNARGWVAALLLNTALSTAGGVLYVRGVHDIGAQKATVFSTVEPLTSVVVGMLVYREAMRLTGALGVACILGGTLLLLSEKKTGAAKGEGAGADGSPAPQKTEGCRRLAGQHRISGKIFVNDSDKREKNDGFLQ